MTTVIRQDPGTRAGRRKTLRRRRVFRRVLVIVLVAALAGGGAYVAVRQVKHKGHKGAAAPVVPQKTALLAMTLHDDPSGQASALTLFGVGQDGSNPVVLFMPVGSLAPIPGAKDIDMVGKALAAGQIGLQQITIENMLGIDVSRTVSIDDVGLGVFIDQLGGIDVNVQESLYKSNADGTRTLIFPTGSRHMNGSDAVTYLTYTASDTTELDSFVRAQKVWEGIFTAAAHGAKLSSAIASLQTSSVASDDAQWLSSIFKAFAARPSGDRTYQVLPGQEIGGGGANLSYQVDDSRVADLVRSSFAGSVPYGVTIGSRVRVQLLNGNGSPEIGTRAASLLVPAGLRIEFTGNADNFRYASTKIVIYGDDARSIAVGQEIRNLLGVGTVAVGARQQTVADVTVVLGKDFLNKVKRS